MKNLQINKKLYVISRRDLLLHQQFIQAAHAGIDFQHEHPIEALDWFKSNYLIFLSVSDINELYQLLEKVDSLGITHTKFYEPDLNNELTAIAFVSSQLTKKLVSKLKLI